MWTKKQIREKLNSDVKWLERGILALYERQTGDERRDETTRHTNNVGFNSPDAPYLTYVGRWLATGHRLSGHHVAKSRSKMLKYSGQLADIANGVR